MKKLNSVYPAAFCRRGVQRLLSAMCLLTALLLSAFGGFAQTVQRASAGQHSGPIPQITIVRISDTAIRTAAVNPRQRSQVESTELIYYVGQREPVTIKISRPLPPRARLYPLVRPRGEKEAWQVQQNAIGPDAAGEWRAEVRFGEQEDLGKQFDLQVMASLDPLPPGPVPKEMIAQNTLAASAIITVERRKARPFVGIAKVGKTSIYGETEPEVGNTALIRVVRRDVPDKCVVGIAIQPIEPPNNNHWIMDEKVQDKDMAVMGRFGEQQDEDQDKYFRFLITAFIIRLDDFSGIAGRKIPAPAWNQLRQRFIAVSRPVTAVRWEGALKIRMIGDIKVKPEISTPALKQTDVTGAIDRRLKVGERIWLVCVPNEGHPWIAGWTKTVRESGKWVVLAARFIESEPSRPFDLVAVVSTKNPDRVLDSSANLKPEEANKKIRDWIYASDHPLRVTEIKVVVVPSGKKIGASRSGQGR